MRESGPVTTGTSSGPSGLGAGGGECGALVRALDWGRTPLGPARALAGPAADRDLDLPRVALRDVRLLGPGARRDLQRRLRPDARGQPPAALGKPLREIWPEIWDQLEPMLDGVRATGQPTWQEDQPLRLERRASGRRPTSPSPSARSATSRAPSPASSRRCTRRPRGCSARAGCRRSPGSARRWPPRTRSRRSPRAAIQALGARARGRPLRRAVRDRRDGSARFAGACRTEDRWARGRAPSAAAGERVLEASGRSSCPCRARAARRPPPRWCSGRARATTSTRATATSSA